MEVVYTEQAKEDLQYWRCLKVKSIQGKIAQLIEAIRKTPFSGIGKPEALKHKWSGCWSRRINQEHRIIYKVEKNLIIVYALRFHYKAN